LIKRTAFLLSAFAVLFVLAARAERPAEPDLFDREIQKEARRLLSDGRVEESLEKFRAMLNLTRKETWTTQALLVCDEKELESKVASLEEATSSTVLVIRRIVDSKSCFRVCAGLFGSRQEAAAVGQQLPSPFREAKPYPLLLVSKGALAKGAFDFSGPAKSSVPSVISPMTVAPAKPVLPQDISSKPEPLEDAARSDDAQELFNKGIEAYNSEDLEAAESYFRRSTLLAPDRFEAFNNLGAVLLHEKKYEDARLALERAVALQPGYPNAHSNLAGALWFLGKRQDAISEAQKAFRLDSHNVRYCTNLASFLFEEKRYSDAQIYLNVVKILDPLNEDALAIQRNIDDALGVAREPKIARSGENAPSPGESSETSKAQEETPPRESPPDKKKKEKRHKEDADGDDGNGGDPSGSKPRKSFLDRFRKNKVADDAKETPGEPPGVDSSEE